MVREWLNRKNSTLLDHPFQTCLTPIPQNPYNTEKITFAQDLLAPAMAVEANQPSDVLTRKSYDSEEANTLLKVFEEGEQLDLETLILPPTECSEERKAVLVEEILGIIGISPQPKAENDVLDITPVAAEGCSPVEAGGSEEEEDWEGDDGEEFDDDDEESPVDEVAKASIFARLGPKPVDEEPRQIQDQPLALTTTKKSAAEPMPALDLFSGLADKKIDFAGAALDNLPTMALADFKIPMIPNFDIALAAEELSRSLPGGDDDEDPAGLFSLDRLDEALSSGTCGMYQRDISTSKAQAARKHENGEDVVDYSGSDSEPEEPAHPGKALLEAPAIAIAKVAEESSFDAHVDGDEATAAPRLFRSRIPLFKSMLNQRNEDIGPVLVIPLAGKGADYNRGGSRIPTWIRPSRIQISEMVDALVRPVMKSLFRKRVISSLKGCCNDFKEDWGQPTFAERLLRRTTFDDDIPRCNPAHKGLPYLAFAA
ncbi:hypothetical protein HDU97_009768 [Phlyctochytrium planicorne]|nr:hypothetical protein HDU97_009768 [Phlyctochytrium planicorne]